MTQHFINDLYKFSSLNKREIDVIICHVLKINTAALMIYDKPLTDPAHNSILKLISQREKGIPFAYITGYKEFWTLTLKVNKHTLIPRPETELLVELVLDHIPKDFEGTILDLGTGTGAIALSLATERPLAKIVAIDSSRECIKVANFNKEKYQLSNVNIYQSNWFSDIKHSTFDIIVSNPPYIDKNDPHLKNLTYEPMAALVAKNKGLNDYFLILKQARKFLKKQGRIFVEHGYNQKKDVQDIFKECHYSSIVTVKDLAGNPRVTSAYY